MSPSRDGDGHSVKRALRQRYPAREKKEGRFRNNTAPALEQQVVKLWKQTGYGRARLSRLLWQREQLAPQHHPSHPRASRAGEAAVP